MKWAIERVNDPTQYSVDPLRFVRTGGRGPDGHIQLKHRTTGLHMPFIMVDYNRSRQMETKTVHEEVILKIVKNWWRDPLLALVASGEVKRWIVATTKMKEGDIIRSHWEIPNITVLPVEGDAYPVGALPVGTQVCLLELHPGDGATVCCAAGTHASIIRRGACVHDLETIRRRQADLLSADGLGDEYTCSVQLSSTRREIRLLPTCVVVAGQVSNEHHNKEKYRKFGEKNWHGIKQRSGLYQKKTGRFGRKIHPVDPVLDCTEESPPPALIQAKFTLPDIPEFTRQREREVYSDLLQIPRPRITPVPGPNNALPHTLAPFSWRHN
ncbi:54S ribosomal protein L2 mitochondrial [Sparganum proliferum]